MKKLWIIITFFVFLLTLAVFAGDKSKKGDKTAYLIEMKHTKSECLKALDEINDNNKDLLSKINWGCLEGNHTGYLIVDASTEKEATKEIPKPAKERTTVYKLSKFTPEQIANYHK
jgi:hypothetical protein